VVLVDTRRIEACFAAIDFFEQRGTPFVVAINTFDGLRMHDVEEVRSALRLSPGVPIKYCDARVRVDVQGLLVAVAEHALRRAKPAGIDPTETKTNVEMAKSAPPV
jgi:signal recognition particle receptor subunit beta